MNNRKYNELDRKIKALENKVNGKEARRRPVESTKECDYICEQCGREFNDFNELEVHAFFKHNVATCPHCLEQYNSHKVYRSLIASGDFICKKCGESFRD